MLGRLHNGVVIVKVGSLPDSDAIIIEDIEGYRYKREISHISVLDTNNLYFTQI